jgi:hypothetical protein
MDYPTAVIEKAKRMEKLLQRVAEGESLQADGKATAASC